MQHVARILLDAADRWPDQTFSVHGGASVTFAELVTLGQRFAGGLDAAGVAPGTPLALLLDDLLDFSVAWWGSLFAGAIPAPLAAPRAHAPGDHERVRLATTQLGGLQVVDRGRASLQGGAGLGGGVLDVGALLAAEPLRELRRGPLALVQFSSGSTRAPRGVALSHENLAANVEQMWARLPCSSEDVKLSWMPHYHDMGLIGCHLLTTRHGMRQIRMQPLEAMRDPLAWARAIEQYGATVLSTTSFALARLNKRLARGSSGGSAPDLSSVRWVYSGAEPVSAAVCARFSELAGLSEAVHVPLYGLAEACVGLTGPDRGGVRTATLGGRDVVGVGTPFEGVELRVVDEADEVVPEGIEGVVHARGPNVSAGYWGAPPREGEWLDTGDRGALIDGELFVTGRVKDVIVVNGRNLHAHDVEEAAEAAAGVRSGGAIAFSDRRGEVEGLALGVVTDKGADTAPTLWAARRAVEAATGASPTVIVPLPAIPRTTSGKKRRAQVRAALEAGALDAAVGNTAAALRVTWEAALGRSLTDDELTRPLGELGGDSVMLAESLAALSARFGGTLDHRLLARAGTLEALALLVEREPPRTGAAAGGAREEPVAVVAATCRLPGADSPEAFWALIRSGEDRIEDGRFGPGGWLEAPDRFDAARFGIGAAEAAAMDPQQRLVLELSDEALERAGAAGEPSVGVYIGAGQQAYMEEVLAHLDVPGALPPGALAGNLLALLASRVSHQLDLRGPALTVDTACSSALVAVHLACQALRRGECELALAGGVNLNLSSAATRLLDRAGVISPSGRCRPFEPGADGTLPGEGAGLVLLQPLSAALAQGRPVLGVIRGTAINNDGRSLGVMAPNPAGQEAVIRQALAGASLPASAIRFVEAHGTGTRLGDAVEAAVLDRCYPHAPARGAVKGQVGHLLAAAGIAGLLRLLGELGVDEAGAVSSFGFGGTNAHAVLTGPTEGAPAMAPPRPVAGERYWLGRAAPEATPELDGWVHVVRSDPGGGLVWSPCPEGPSPLVEGGRYLITGGTGGLGQILARHLARAYKARLTLLSRSASRERWAGLARDIERSGGAVVFEAIDLAEPAAVARLHGQRYDGVFHLAGTTGADAARAKRDGLGNLEGVEAGFWALYSSIAGVLPGLDGGLKDYAAANAWLDAYAVEARAAGRAVVSVSWGPWAGSGMAGAHAEAFRVRGITPVDAPRAMAALERALGSGEAHVVVMDRGRARDAAAPLPEDLEGQVVALIARAADLDPDEVDRESTLTELGVDSLEALELVKSLEAIVGRGLPTTLLYEHDTLPALLAALRGGAEREDAAPVEASGPLAGAALLPSQQTFVVQQAFFPEMPGNVFMGVTVAAPDGAALDRDRLAAALAAVCARHPVLGSVIRREAGALRELEAVAFPALEWGAIDEDAVAAQTFDVDQGPLCRALCDGRRLVLNAHHSVIDAWSLKNVLEELLAAYVGEALPPLRSTWRQAAALLATSTDEADLAWWRERYAGGVPPLNLPWRAPVDAPTAGGCGVDRRVLSPTLSEALARRAREAGVSLPSLALALYMRALYDASGQQSVTVRVAQARRELRLPDVARLVGSFADSLPVTGQVSAGEPLLALARRVHATLSAARAHSQASSMALSGLSDHRAAGPVGLTPAGFSFPLMREEALPGGLTLDDVQGRAGAGFTRLTLVAWRLNGRVHAAFNYARSHLDAATAGAVADTFEALAREVADGEGAREPGSLHLRVLARCRRHPERVAVSGVTYGQLDRRSGALASLLAHVGPGDRVAVLAHPGPEAVVALLAALRTGAAFVPLDPSWPDARVVQVLGVAAPSAVLAPPALRERAVRLATGIPVLTVGEAERPVVDGPPAVDGALEVDGGPESLAWVMFTSGSTGRPKGVVVTHRAALGFLDWVSRVFGVTESDRFVQTASLGYGGAIRQIFSPLLAGGTIHPVPPEVKRDPDALVAFMHAEGVTIWNSVPSLWGHLMDAAERSPLAAPFAAVRWVLVGGEAVPADMVRRWRARFPGRVANLYGSTETIVNATFFEVVRPPEGLHTPIGWARGGVHVHLLDVADGAGEIAVSGAIASGYWRDPEAEAAAFVDHPTLGRLYRTGDLARRGPGGALVFAGRKDSQVQVHGNRVELLEVEHALASHPGVDAAVVVFHDRRLTAFVEADAVDTVALRAWMDERLPEYMVPHRFRLGPVPRNAAGKADRRVAAGMLVAPGEAPIEASVGAPAEAPVGAPVQATGVSDVIALIAAAWRAVLDLPELPGEDDDFFALGGDSIRALEVLDHLRGRTRGTLRPLALYRHRRLGSLAAAIAALEPTPAPAPARAVEGPEYPLSTVQRGFWTSHRAAGEAPVWAAEVPVTGPMNPRALQRALDLVVARHDVLRSRFRQGRSGPVQRTGPADDVPLRFDDLSRLPPRVREGALAQRWAEAAAEDFPLDGWPLFSARLIRESATRHRLLLASHHIVSDAWSCWVMAGELLRAHDDLAAGRAPALPPVRASLREHVSREPQDVDPWWTVTLGGLTQRAATPEQVGREERQRVIERSPRAWRRLKARARAARVSPFVLVLRALIDAIGEASGADDVVIATAVSGREGLDSAQGELAGLVAPLARGLPVRGRPGEGVAVARDAFVAACDHADASPVSMVAALGAQAMEILGRYFLTWLDPSAVPQPDTACALDWSGARFRFATGATNTELFASALVGDGFRLTLRGGPLVERVAPLLERRLSGGADAALVIYAPDGLPIPVSAPLVVEEVDVGATRSELVLLPWSASEVARRPGLEAAVSEAIRAASAPVVALAGVLPARTGLAAKPLAPAGVTLTTGHAATVVAMLLNVRRALAETGQDWRHLTVGALGYGAIGQAVLRLCVAVLGEPAAVWIEDPGRADSRSVVGAELILGATSGGATLDVAALPPGTVVVDDSFPRAFDEATALERMRSRGDVLLLGGGMLDAGPLARRSPFPQAAAIRARYPSRWLPGCHAEALLIAREPGLGPTVGVVSEGRALAMLAAVEAAGWAAPPLHLGTWEVTGEVLLRHRSALAERR